MGRPRRRAPLPAWASSAGNETSLKLENNLRVAVGEILSDCPVECPDVSDALDRCDWSEVSVRLRDAGLEDLWERVREEILRIDPTADA